MVEDGAGQDEAVEQGERLEVEEVGEERACDRAAEAAFLLRR